MKGFSLYCRGEGFKEGKWYFDRTGGGMDVSDPGDRVVCRFAHHEADDRFILPSFWRSIKYIGFKMDDGSTVWFEPEGKAVARVKAYLDDALALQGMKAVRALRKKGWLNVLTGLGLVLFGVALILLFFNILGIRHRAGGYAFAAAILLGVGETAWGVSSLFRAWRLRRRLERGDERQAQPDPGGREEAP